MPGSVLRVSRHARYERSLPTTRTRCTACPRSRSTVTRARHSMHGACVSAPRACAGARARTNTPAQAHSLTHSLAYSLTYTLTHSLANSRTARQALMTAAHLNCRRNERLHAHFVDVAAGSCRRHRRRGVFCESARVSVRWRVRRRTGKLLAGGERALRARRRTLLLVPMLPAGSDYASSRQSRVRPRPWGGPAAA